MTSPSSLRWRRTTTSTDMKEEPKMTNGTWEQRAREQADALRREWATAERWSGIERAYTADEVVRLRGSVRVDASLARLGTERLWNLLNTDDFVPALGAMTGGQAVEMVKAGLKAIYVSGWQTAADANLSEEVYPDQSLYPANSVPA